MAITLLAHIHGQNFVRIDAVKLETGIADAYKLDVTLDELWRTRLQTAAIDVLFIRDTVVITHTVAQITLQPEEHIVMDVPPSMAVGRGSFQVALRQTDLHSSSIKYDVLGIEFDPFGDWSGGGGGTGAIVVADDEFFADNAARDAFYIAHPDRLKENGYCVVNNKLQQYRHGTWIDMTPIVRGPQGPAGLDNLLIVDFIPTVAQMKPRTGYLQPAGTSIYYTIDNVTMQAFSGGSSGGSGVIADYVVGTHYQTLHLPLAGRADDTGPMVLLRTKSADFIAAGMAADILAGNLEAVGGGAGDGDAHTVKLPPISQKISEVPIGKMYSVAQLNVVWDPAVPVTPPPSSGGFQNVFLFAFDNRLGGIWQPSAADIASIAPSSGMVAGGIYFIMSSEDGSAFNLLETLYNGTTWRNPDPGSDPPYTYHLYLTPEEPADQIRVAIANGSVAPWTCNVLLSANTTMYIPGMEKDLKDIVINRPKYENISFLERLKTSTQIHYNTLLTQTTDTLKYDLSYEDINIHEPLRVYSIDHDFFIRFNMDRTIDIVVEDLTVRTLHLGDTYEFTKSVAFDFYGVVGDEGDFRLLQHVLKFSGEAFTADFSYIFAAISDTAIRANKALQVKPEENYSTIDGIKPPTSTSVWRVITGLGASIFPDAPEGCIYVDNWKITHTERWYHLACTSNGWLIKQSRASSSDPFLPWLEVGAGNEPNEFLMRKLVYNHFAKGTAWDIYPGNVDTHRITYIKVAEVADDPLLSNDQFSYVVKGFNDFRTRDATIYTQIPNRIEITGANKGGLESIIFRRVTPPMHPYKQFIWHDTANNKFKAYVGGVSDMDDTIIEGIQARAMFDPEVRYVSIGRLLNNPWEAPGLGEWRHYHVERAMALDSTNVRITHEADVFYIKGSNTIFIVNDSGAYYDLSSLLANDETIYDVYCKVFNPINIAGHVQVVTNKGVRYIRLEPESSEWNLYHSDPTLEEANLRANGLTGDIKSMNHIDTPLTYIVTTTGLWVWLNNVDLQLLIPLSLSAAVDIHPNIIQIDGYTFYTFASDDTTYWIKATDNLYVQSNLNLLNGAPLRIYQWEGMGFFQVCRWGILKLSVDSGNLVFTQTITPNPAEVDINGFLSDKRFVVPILYGSKGLWRLSGDFTISQVSDINCVAAFANWTDTVAYFSASDGQLHEMDITDLSTTNVVRDVNMPNVLGGAQVAGGDYVVALGVSGYLRRLITANAQNPQTWGWIEIPNSALQTTEIEHRGQSMDYIMQELIPLTRQEESVKWKAANFEQFNLGLASNSLEKGMYEISGFRMSCKMDIVDTLVTYINTGCIVETDGYVYLSVGGYTAQLANGILPRINKITKQIELYNARNADYQPSFQDAGAFGPKDTMRFNEHPNWALRNYNGSSTDYGMQVISKRTDEVSRPLYRSPQGPITQSTKNFYVLPWYVAGDTKDLLRNLLTNDKSKTWFYGTYSTNMVGMIGLLDLSANPNTPGARLQATTLAGQTSNPYRQMQTLVNKTNADGTEHLLVVRGSSASWNQTTTDYEDITPAMSGGAIDWTQNLTTSVKSISGIANAGSFVTEKSFPIKFNDGTVAIPTVFNPGRLGFVSTAPDGSEFVQYDLMMSETVETSVATVQNSFPINAGGVGLQYAMLVNSLGQFGAPANDLPVLVLITRSGSGNGVSFTPIPLYDPTNLIPIINRPATSGVSNQASQLSCFLPYLVLDENSGCFWFMYVKANTGTTGRKWQIGRYNMSTQELTLFNTTQFDELGNGLGKTNCISGNYNGGLKECECIFFDRETGKTFIYPNGETCFMVIHPGDSIQYCPIPVNDMNFSAGSISETYMAIDNIPGFVVFGCYWAYDLTTKQVINLQKLKTEPYYISSQVQVQHYNKNKITFADGQQAIIAEGASGAKALPLIGKFFDIETYLVNSFHQAKKVI